MIKRIAVSNAKIGMYVYDMDGDWKNHPYLSTRFAIDSQTKLREILQSGVREIYIDTSLGADEGPDRPSKQPAKRPVHRAARPRVDAVAEFSRVKKVFEQSSATVKNLMRDIRLGRQVELDSLEPMAEGLIESAFRNHYALTGICRLKTKDEYTFMHSVSVAGLLVAFARDLGRSDDDLKEFAMGGLLHDIGKCMIPNAILNKPAKLEPDEFEIIKTHVRYSGEIIKTMRGVSDIAVEITMQHHEKIDGSGYPLGLLDHEISEAGKMAAIVDMYDALTSERVYKAAWQPTYTLKSMMEWSPTSLSRELVEYFVRCLGIYPVGSLVQLESGLVGLVIDQTDDLLRPQIRLFSNMEQGRHEPLKDVDMSNATDMASDKIKHIIDPGRLGINIQQFL